MLTYTQNVKAEQANFCGETIPEQSKVLSQIPSTLYSIVSGIAGTKRNWQLMRDLFASSAKISPVLHKPSGQTVVTMDLEEFIKLNQNVFANVDFFETEVKQKIHQFGHSATIISQYESRSAKDAKPYSTGVNSFQLINDGHRWCVISVTWDSDKNPNKQFTFQLEPVRENT